MVVPETRWPQGQWEERPPVFDGVQSLGWGTVQSRGLGDSGPRVGGSNPR